MFAVYNYSAAATIYNIAADIAAILTGETNKANLSAGCDQANTSILTTYSIAGWTMHDQTANTMSTVTFTNATNVCNKAAHGLAANEPVSFTNTGGALPTELTANTVYYVLSPAADTFKLSATPGGAEIDLTGDGTGTHTGWNARKQMLKARVVDDAAAFKYIQLDYTSAGYAQLHLFDGWTIATTGKTAGNQATALSTARSQRITVGEARTMTLASYCGTVQTASSRMLVMQSTIGAGVGNASGGWTAVFERSRLSPWDTVANGYLPAVLACGDDFSASGAVYSKTCKYKNPVTGDYTGANAIVQTAIEGWTSTTAAINATTSIQKIKIPDGLGGFFCPFNEIKFSYAVNAFMGGSISAISDVWMPPLYVQNLDRATYSGKTYVFFQNTSTPASLGCIAVPRG